MGVTDRYTLLTLRQRQGLPLEAKIVMARDRIREWYEKWEGDVYVAFSGGKDSTVLLHLVRQMYPEVPAVFAHTGLEYPEIVAFAGQTKNCTMIRPKMSFREVLQQYGYPVVSKKVARGICQLQNPTAKNENIRRLYREGVNRFGVATPSFKIPKKWLSLVDAPFKVSDTCCDAMKKRPIAQYEKQAKTHPMTGTMASDSQAREKSYLQRGCNSFDTKRPVSNPLGVWMEQDVLRYLVEKKVPYCSIYGDIVEENEVLRTTGETRTGCVFCMFGIMFDKDRFVRMERTHPQLHKYCMENLGLKEVLEFIGVPHKGT